MFAPGLFESIGTLEAAACVVLAAVLLLRGGGRPAPIVLGANFLALGGILAFLSIPTFFSEVLPPWAELGAYVCRVALWASLLAFVVAYPHWTLSPRKVWGLVLALLPGAFILFALIVNPALFVSPQGGPTTLFKALALGLRDATLIASLYIFAKHWHRAQGRPRQQYLVVLLVYILYGVNDSVGALAPLLQPSVIPADPFLVFLSVACLLTVLGVAAVAATRLDLDGKYVFYAVAASLALAFVQFFGSELGRDELFLHFLVDGFGAFLLFWGVARHHILDIDLKVKFGIRSGVLGGVALGIVFVVQQVIERFVGETFGILIGALAAGTALVLLTPLQRLAERLSDTAMPQVAAKGGAEAYLTYRRLAIYRSAVEGLIRDGLVDLENANALAALRTQLHITTAEHAMIEAEVRAEIRLMGDARSASPA